MSALSKVLSMDNSKITGIIDRLEKPGFVSRNANPVDRRIFRIYITTRGVTECNRAKTVVKSVNEEIKSGLSESEIDTFKRVLNSFFEKFSNG